jgi:DNA invertase Pin-like site-specific DNA recombinase
LSRHQGVSPFQKPGDTLVVWNLDRLGRSLLPLLDLLASLRDGGVAFWSLAESMDTNTPHGELLFHIFGVLEKYKRALIKERIQVRLAVARHRGRHDGLLLAIEPEKLDAAVAALDGGASKEAVCRTFGIASSTLIDTPTRVGWTRPGSTRRSPDAGQFFDARAGAAVPYDAKHVADVLGSNGKI